MLYPLYSLYFIINLKFIDEKREINVFMYEYVNMIIVVFYLFIIHF